MSKRAKPKRRYFVRLRRLIGFDHHLMKLKRWWKQKLRKILGNILGFDDVNYIAYNLLYEMQDVIANNRPLFVPRVATADETFDELLHTEKSFARFGDGEFGMMFFGTQIGFQQRDELMLERLKEVLVSQEPNLMIGLINVFGMQGLHSSHRAWAGKMRQHINPLLDETKQYYDAGAMRTSLPEHYMKLKKIWAGKKVVTIEGSMCRLGVGNDLFDGASSFRRILAPAECAFSAYDRILTEALKIEKDALFLIALGPTATVLTHDLHKAGYRAIDIGHLDIAYELFLRNKEQRMVAIEGKYVNEASYRAPADCNDPNYLSQIIVEVKLT